MIGVTTNAIMYQYPQADLAQTLKMLGEDFKLIEIDGSRFSLDQNQQVTLAKMAKLYDLKYRIHAPVFGINLASNQENIRTRSVAVVKYYIDAARKLGAQSVNVHAGNMLTDFDPYLQEKMGGRGIFLNYSKTSIEELLDFSKQYGVHLTVENMFGPFSIGLTTEEMSELTKGGAGYCFDCGHAHLSQALDDFVEKMPSPDYMHFCDSDSRVDHLPVGHGEINFREILGKLKPKSDDIILEIISTHDHVRRSKEIIESMIK